MNLQEAIEILSEEGFMPEKIGKDEIYIGLFDCVEDAAYVIRRARKLRGPKRYNKTLKNQDHRINRRATKQAIHHEEWERIQRGKKVKEEDIWNWD